MLTMRACAKGGLGEQALALLRLVCQEHVSLGAADEVALFEMACQACLRHSKQPAIVTQILNLMR
jgi:hypothetical protein